MSDAAKLFASQMGTLAVLGNVLLDKGVISRKELIARLQQAHEAAQQCSGGPDVAIALAELLHYLVDTDHLVTR
jgi:hypothetical protein